MLVSNMSLHDSLINKDVAMWAGNFICKMEKYYCL